MAPLVLSLLLPGAGHALQRRWLGSAAFLALGTLCQAVAVGAFLRGGVLGVVLGMLVPRALAALHLLLLQDAGRRHHAAAVGVTLVGLAAQPIAAGLGFALATDVYTVPSSNMAPTLLPGDAVVAEPADPIERGDVVVFEYPRDRSIHYVKRVVAVGGDRIEVRDNRVLLDGQPVPTEPIGAGTFFDSRCAEQQVHLHRESFDGRSWTIATASRTGPGPLADLTEKVVPPGHVFVLGDNRDYSEDSRRWGFVPLDHVVGRIDSILYSTARCPDETRADRTGLSITGR